MNEHILSRGHICFIGDYEFFTFEGELYKAKRTNYIDVRGYRVGARWESPNHMIEITLEKYRSFVYQPKIPGF